MWGVVRACKSAANTLTASFVRSTEGWCLNRGEVTVDAPVLQSADSGDIQIISSSSSRSQEPLLRGEPLAADGAQITFPETVANAFFERVAGQRPYHQMITPWPRTEWTISRQTSAPQPANGILIGDGPSHLNYDAAAGAFFDGTAANHNRSYSDLWRIIRHERRAWIHRLTIAADRLVAIAKGDDLVGVVFELTTSTSNVVRPIGSTGRVTIKLPSGLPQRSLVLLRTADDWLDQRYFDTQVPGQHRDSSVVFEQPGAELELLIAGGEGQYVEFKETISSQQESKRRFLKTIAAFASGDTGTILFGVNDEGRVVGLPAPERDKMQLIVSSAIRDNIDPEPPYAVRWVEHESKHVLIVEVQRGNGWYALDPKKPEFYVRRGASTMPARLNEISAGFGGVAHRAPTGY